MKIPLSNQEPIYANVEVHREHDVVAKLDGDQHDKSVIGQQLVNAPEQLSQASQSQNQEDTIQVIDL